MSTQPPVSSPSFLRRKVAGIPVIYLAGGFVVILAALAWNMKGQAAAPVADTSEPVDTGTILEESAVPPVPVGTVVAAPPVAPALDNASIETNDDWLKRGVAYAIKRGHNPGGSQTALQKYLDGADLTYGEGIVRDEVIRELGLPPYPPANVGSVRPDVARVQGPLPREHVVKNQAEDSAGELAALYYGPGRSWQPIASANGGAVKFKIGQSVKIPVYPVPKPPAAKPAVK